MSGKPRTPISAVDDPIADLKQTEKRCKNYFGLVQSYIKNNARLRNDPDTQERRWGDFSLSFCDALAEKFLAVAVSQQKFSSEQQREALQQVIAIVKTNIKTIWDGDDAAVSAGEGRFTDCLMHRLSGEKGKLVKTVVEVLCNHEAMKKVVEEYLPNAKAMQDDDIFDSGFGVKRKHKVVLERHKLMLDMMVHAPSVKPVIRDYKHSAAVTVQEPKNNQNTSSRSVDSKTAVKEQVAMVEAVQEVINVETLNTEAEIEMFQRMTELCGHSREEVSKILNLQMDNFHYQVAKKCMELAARGDSYNFAYLKQILNVVGIAFQCSAMPTNAFCGAIPLTANKFGKFFVMLLSGQKGRDVKRIVKGLSKQGVNFDKTFLERMRVLGNNEAYREEPNSLEAAHAQTYQAEIGGVKQLKSTFEQIEKRYKASLEAVKVSNLLVSEKTEAKSTDIFRKDPAGYWMLAFCDDIIKECLQFATIENTYSCGKQAKALALAIIRINDFAKNLPHNFNLAEIFTYSLLVNLSGKNAKTVNAALDVLRGDLSMMTAYIGFVGQEPFSRIRTLKEKDKFNAASQLALYKKEAQTAKQYLQESEKLSVSQGTPKKPAEMKSSTLSTLPKDKPPSGLGSVGSSSGIGSPSSFLPTPSPSNKSNNKKSASRVGEVVESFRQRKH